MKKMLGSITVLALCFFAGYSALVFNSEINSINRDPAAIRNNFDFSHLKGDDLQVAVRRRLLAGMQIKKQSEGAGIELGHFVYLNGQGQKKLACQEFQKVFLNFEAEGMSVSGEKPQMEVEGQCDYSADMARINALYLPVAKILGEAPADGEFQFNDGPKVTVRFMNVPDAWPKLWLLKSVRLVNENATEALTIESEEVAQTLGHPVVFTW